MSIATGDGLQHGADGPRRVVSRWHVALAAGADAVALVAFVAMGQSSHDEGAGISGVAQVVAPFLVGAAVGWLIARAWRHPLEVAPTGVVVWIATLVVGLVLRRLGVSGDDRGTATSFVIVATVVTGVLLLGWRALVLSLPWRFSRHK